MTDIRHYFGDMIRNTVFVMINHNYFMYLLHRDPEPQNIMRYFFYDLMIKISVSREKVRSIKWICRNSAAEYCKRWNMFWMDNNILIAFCLVSSTNRSTTSCVRQHFIHCCHVPCPEKFWIASFRLYKVLSSFQARNKYLVSA